MPIKLYLTPGFPYVFPLPSSPFLSLDSLARVAIARRTFVFDLSLSPGRSLERARAEPGFSGGVSIDLQNRKRRLSLRLYQRCPDPRRWNAVEWKNRRDSLRLSWASRKNDKKKILNLSSTGLPFCTLLYTVEEPHWEATWCRFRIKEYIFILLFFILLFADPHRRRPTWAWLIFFIYLFCTIFFNFLRQRRRQGSDRYRSFVFFFLASIGWNTRASACDETVRAFAMSVAETLDGNRSKRPTQRTSLTVKLRAEQRLR